MQDFGDIERLCSLKEKTKQKKKCSYIVRCKRVELFRGERKRRKECIFILLQEYENWAHPKYGFLYVGFRVSDFSTCNGHNAMN